MESQQDSVPARRRCGVLALYGALWRHAEGGRAMLIVAMGLLVLSQAFKLAMPYFAARAIDALQLAGADGVREAGRYMVLAFGACLLAWMLHGPARVMERLVAARVRARFADALYARIVALPLRWHERHHSGDTLHRVDRSTRALFGFAQQQFVYLQNAVNLVGPIAALLLISTVTGLAALAGYVVLALLLIRVDRVTLSLTQAENREERRYASALVDCLGNVSTVLMLRLQGATRCLLASRLAAILGPFRRNIAITEAKWCAVDLLNSALRCGLVVLYAWLAWRHGGAVLIGSAIMVYQYTQQAGGVVNAVAGHHQELIRHQGDFAGAEEILEAEARPGLPAPAIPPGWREISVANLRFCHPGRSVGAPALADLSFVLRRGSRIALVGESGSGKSTLMRVLAGLYRAERAAFAIDGSARSDLADLGSIATLLPQDPEIFENSIEHNLTLGLEHAPEAVARACELARFAPVLERLPGGIETLICERGVNLSGGEKQRLALARGILAANGSSLLMLDEPTSSIDPETEALIYDALFRGFADACIVSAVHRLHLLPRFDRVVVMERGRILDIGAVRDLLARQPAFRALWRRSVVAPQQGEDARGTEPLAA